MDDVSCPRCKTTKYRNPSLKLMVNNCGHALCDNCVELVFIKGSANCPTCKILLRKTGFRIQVFEDPLVEKDIDIRKKILRDFNMREEDFQNLREYNDYLEMVETIVFNLTNNVDVESTKRNAEQWKKDHATAIKRNRGKVSKDEEMIEELLEQEQIVKDFRSEQIKKEDLDKKKAKLKDKEELIDELMCSDLSAGQILAMHSRQKQEAAVADAAEQKAKLPPEFSTGIKLAKAREFLPIPKAPVEKLYEYEPLEIETLGPNAPTDEQLDDFGYLLHIRDADVKDKAGGYEAKIACQRALQDAFGGLYYELQF